MHQKSLIMRKEILSIAISLITLIGCQKGTQNIEEYSVQYRLDTGTPVSEIIEDTPLFHILGKYYQGGVIFQIDADKGTGMIVTETNIGGAVQWGCYNQFLNIEDEEFGTGKKNTELILAGCPYPGIAASICDTLNIDGYDDWFLPSKDELYNALIGLSVWANPITKPSHEELYWSSTEANSARAAVYKFKANEEHLFDDELDKNETALLRAVREFKF